jgi:hypothetical protein
MPDRASDAGEASVCQGERDRLATELRYATRRHNWDPSPEIIMAIVEWHMRAVAIATADVWVPGMAGSRDSFVQTVVDRFHTHQVGDAIGRLVNENTDLKLRLLQTLECVRFYADGATDGGCRAKAALAPLLSA